MAVGLLAALGLCALGGGAAGLVAVHDRTPTSAQVAAAGKRDFALRWRRLTAGQIFPATVSYTTSTDVPAQAVLVGIAPAARCSRAFDPKAAHALESAGCVTVLRATYADSSRTVLATVGVAVMRTSSGASSAFSAIVRDKLGALLPVSFPRTIAARFTARARETSSEEVAGGPYLLFDTAGYSDGRRTTDLTDGEAATDDLPTGLTNALAGTFGVPVHPCAERGVRC